MSGIYAILNLQGQPIDSNELAHLAQPIRLMGSDSYAQNTYESVGLCHSLFATNFYDGQVTQPYVLRDQFHVVADARIDGQAELVSQMSRSGYHFERHLADVELIAYAYQIWGEDCLNYLIGDFAFVIWDENKKKLFAACDQMGLRILYYTQNHHRLIVTNSFQALCEDPEVSHTLNEVAIAGFLMFANYRWLDKSITTYADIQRLADGHQLVWQKHSGLRINRYWTFSVDQALINYECEQDYLDHFLAIFREAVRDRMNTDRILLSLSGGVDSSSIAAIVSQIIQESHPKISVVGVTNTYERIHPDSEGYYAEVVAKHLGIPHHLVVWDEMHAKVDFQNLATRYALEPVAALYSIDSLNFTANQVPAGRVLLCGHGGDELLSCSPAGIMLKEMNFWSVWITFLQHAWRYRRKPDIGTGLLGRLAGNSNGSSTRSRNRDYPVWLSPEFEARIQARELWESSFNWQPDPVHPRHPKSHRALAAAAWTTTEKPTAIQKRVMQIRNPYLDLRLIEFFHSLPPLPWMFRKYLVRHSMTQLLPEVIIRRPKTPLGSLADSIMDLSDLDWVDHWKPISILDQFVVREAIPPLWRNNTVGKNQDLTPLHLNCWLQSAYSRHVEP